MKKEAVTPPMPQFTPWLPEKLLNEDTTPKEVYLLEQTSILRQQTAWQSIIIEELYGTSELIKTSLGELEDFKLELEYNSKIIEKLDDQKKEFKFTQQKWFKIGMYIFFLVVYPLYLVTLQEAGLVKTIISGIGLMAK